MNARGHPMMIVVAGPAGSGKSTVFPLASFGVDFFNVDDRCAELNGGSYAGISTEIRAQAGAECQAFVDAHIAAHRDFAVETTLRTGIAVDQAIAARATGFRSLLLFMATEDVRINIARIAARGHIGGHSSPEAEIRAIFSASMANLPRAIPVFERVECFDNSRSGQRPARVLTFEDGQILRRVPVLPAWARAVADASRM